MKTKSFPGVLLLTITVLSGCSNSDVTQIAQLPTQEIAAAIKSVNALPAGMALPTGQASDEAASAELDAIDSFRNPFAPPKQPASPPVIDEPVPAASLPDEPTPEVRQPGTPPKIRLLGFLNVGEPKVLVAFQDRPQTLAVGDTLEGLKVLGIESPELTMLFEDREIKFSLFDQQSREASWKPAAGRNANASPANSSARTTGSTARSTFASARGDRPMRGSSVPGFSPNSASPPAFRPPTPPAIGDVPGTTSATPPAGLPGLTSQHGGNETSGVTGIPNIPGFDVGGNGQVGVRSLPTLPGSLP